MKNVFYKGSESSPAKPRASEQKSANLNPFDGNNDIVISVDGSANGSSSKVKIESKSIFQITEMFKKIDLKTIFGAKKQMKLTQVYNVLTSELDQSLRVQDLKVFNQYLIEKQSQGMDEDVQFLDIDDTMIDL